MSELSDDIARGCLENGEPIEARWGTGEWSEQPAQQPEPDPWEQALAEAKAEGVREGLDLVKSHFTKYPSVYNSMYILEVVEKLRSDYEKGGEHG